MAGQSDSRLEVGRIEYVHVVVKYVVCGPAVIFDSFYCMNIVLSNKYITFVLFTKNYLLLTSRAIRK